MTSYKTGDSVRVTAEGFEDVEAVYAKPFEPGPDHPGIEASGDLHVLEVRGRRLAFFGDEFGPLGDGIDW